MSVLVSPSFFGSADRLEASERSRVFDFLSKFYENPAHPSLSLERIGKGTLWSARITQELRAIVHRDGEVNALLYAAHHDEAYTWAERRRGEYHSVTGELQIVVLPETVREDLPWTAERRPKVDRLLARHEDAYLVSLGVPADWLPVLRAVTTEDELLEVAGKLPEDVAERLLRISAGELVTPPPVSVEQHAGRESEPRRFWVIESASDLADLLAKPIEAWVRFLHPSQRSLAEGTFNGPVKVTGSAGTGKTVVAMHRARYLSRQGKRVLLTSFVGTLCKNISRNLRVLCSDDERSRITVATIDSQARALLPRSQVRELASNEETRAALKAAASYAEGFGDVDFLDAEWEGVVVAQGLVSWSEYRDAQRTGRGRALGAADRKKVWAAFERALEKLEAGGKLPGHVITRRATDALMAGTIASPFDAVLVDEVQDLSIAALRFVRALVAKDPPSLMLFGDGGQRIYRRRFSLRALGIDVRGRAKTLRLNYRTTRQIQQAADRILSSEADDLDGGTESRTTTQSLLRGPEPSLRGYKSSTEHNRGLTGEIRRLLADGLAPREIAIFARTNDLVKELRDLLHREEIPYEILDRDTDVTVADGVCLGTMHRAKGLEFKAVLVPRCEDGSMPPTPLINRTKDPADREAIVAEHRQLLYVAVTRARDEAVITWVGKPSSFLAPLLGEKESTA